MVVVHSTKNVVLKRCNFLDSTLVLISGARVQVKDTLFTQDDSSTYECSIVASGENTVLSMHGGKISGGVVGLSLIHISEPTRRYAISYAVFCLKKKT